MNLYTSFNQLFNVNNKRSVAATLRGGGIPRGEREPRIGSIQLRCKPRRVASSPRGIPPLHKVLFTSRFRQLITKEYLEIHPNLFIVT